MISPKQRWTIAGLFIGASLVGWLAAMYTGRTIENMAALPDGESVAEVEVGLPAPEDLQNEDDGPDLASNGRPGRPGRDGPGRSGRTPRTSKSAYVRSIVERSIFDSSKVGRSEPEGPIDTTGGQKTDLKVVLIATVVSNNEEYSSALIADESGSSSGYGVNDSLLGQATIIAIEPRKVVIQRDDNSVEYIEMEEEAEQEQRRPRRPGIANNNSEESGVESVGENRYVVDAETLEQLMENPEQLYSQIRVVPHKDSNGDVDGYRLSGIRRNSFFYQLGVKNGDIVHSVNGRPLTSASAGMDAYNTLADAKDFSFELTRRNQRQTFEYEVR